MYTTVEQKLSAIKAINEAKERAEFSIRMCVSVRQNKSDKIRFSNAYDFEITKDIRDKMIDIIEAHFKDEVDSLIEKAEALMK